jgi:hypothetical protein
MSTPTNKTIPIPDSASGESFEALLKANSRIERLTAENATLKEKLKAALKESEDYASFLMSESRKNEGQMRELIRELEAKPDC